MSCASQTSACSCTKPSTSRQTAWWLLGFSAVGGGLWITFQALEPQATFELTTPSLGVVLLMGFLTGLHCIGMCGGIVTAYLRFSRDHRITSWQSHMMYGAAKTCSYAGLGAAFGWLGSAVHFSNDLKSFVSIMGGICLLYIGIKSLGLIRLPLMARWTQWLGKRASGLAHPIYAGLLNGLMISCAPLQALYLVSAGLGDPLQGALLLAIFSVGTLPIFLFYGGLVSVMSTWRSQWPERITTAMILVYGMLMVNRGLAIGGYSLTLPNRAQTIWQNPQELPPQPLQMTANAKGWSKSSIPFEAGRCIRWEIWVEEVTYCNKEIEVPALGLKLPLTPGLNVLEFDPGAHQVLVYTCWMGMMNGQFEAISPE
ncbi:sulfite exporter TauE/SafE family protein [Pontibacter sp. G13]|uniref:urease accessory protein UreH domain-containing protein n=1 Tax=Pontibacter sp. G13 TaxID=3074898 RepID=UPI00288BCA80|nr:sulfite exporter TauE/SafE family protein [Pontibacter sp. G13]WNJ17186.1 sulfite exporter TauE/SafE family protein [Pontibacter sp. G13]